MSAGEGRAFVGLALEQGRACLDEQQAALGMLRSRSVGFVATVLAVAGFVGSQGSTDGVGARAVQILALWATTSVAIIAIELQRPRTWQFTMRSDVLAGTAWIEADEPERELALYLAEFADANETHLSDMHHQFQWELGFGSLAVSLWLIQALL